MAKCRLEASLSRSYQTSHNGQFRRPRPPDSYLDSRLHEEASVKNYNPAMSFGKDVAAGDPGAYHAAEEVAVLPLCERAEA